MTLQKKAEKAAEILLGVRSFALPLKFQRHQLHLDSWLEAEGRFITVHGSFSFDIFDTCEHARKGREQFYSKLNLGPVPNHYPVPVYEKGRIKWYWVIEEKLS